MSQHRPTCRNCRTTMEEGWVADKSHANSVDQAKWVAGEPQHQKWLGMNMGITTKGKKQFDVTVWRCDKCGLLESYAL